MLGSPGAGRFRAAYYPSVMPKILVVVDAPWVRNDVHAALSQPGFELTDHDQPATVVDVVAEDEPDGVILDLQVGTMGGMAITRALLSAAELGNAPPVPVVMLLDRAADTFLARRAGAHAWVQKPFTANDLRQALETATEAVRSEIDA